MPSGEREWGEVDRGTRIARVATFAVFILVALFPLAMLYRLLMPPPIPTLSAPEPNGWDDLMAAGEMIGPDNQRKLIQWRGTKRALPRELYNAEAVARMRRGLSRELANPYSYRMWPEAEIKVFAQVYVAVSAYALAAHYDHNLDSELDANWDYLRIANEEGRTLDESGSINSNSYQEESIAIAYYWRLRERLSLKQCNELLAKLVDYDKRRDTWENKHARQRVIDANAGWQTRMKVILADWSGADPYPEGYVPYNPVLRLRLLICDLAVRAYQMKHSKLPNTLDEVVPEFLPAVPMDPFSGGPTLYRKVDGGYILYSVGSDGDDDGGRPVTNSSLDGDDTADLMFQ
jgi:hypothetical protein